MNFIRQIIDIANQNEIADFQENIIRLLDEIKTYQIKVQQYIVDNYVEFLPNTINNVQLFSEGNRLLSESKSILNHSSNEMDNELITAIDGMEEYVNDLTELSLTLRTSNKILKIDELFQELNDAKNNVEFMKITAIIGDIKALINDPMDQIFSKLDCFENIKIQWRIERESSLHNIKQRFDELVQFNEKQFVKTKSISLKISKDEDKLHDTVIALMESKYNPRQLCTFLMENVFTPIILQPVSIQYDDTRSDYVCLTLSYSIQQPLADDLRPDYKIVFKNIEIIMHCLGYMNIAINANECVLRIFGDHIKNSFFDLLIKNCLPYSLPTTMDDMNESTMIDDIISLNDFLCKMLFLQETDDELKDFALKIDTLFKKKFCLKIMDSAIEIMHKELHYDMQLVNDETNNSHTDSPSAFPKCMVSKSTLELISLLENVMLQITTTNNDELSDQLLSTISMIFERYVSEVPAYHQELLTKIPQQSALLYNNCMYLAHWLAKNGTKNCAFSSTVKTLQNCGTEQFNHQATKQRHQLMDILRDFDLTGIETELDIMPQKVVRQCLRQLDLLKNVWQPILPEPLYNNKTMGIIINDFCSELIRRILIIEDISTSVSDGLVNIFDSIIAVVPTYFTTSMYVTVEVKSWQKLMQLKMILNASLADIVDQWAEGKGVLSLNFKADEIKKLIRALFQNTDRRSKALARII